MADPSNPVPARFLTAAPARFHMRPGTARIGVRPMLPVIYPEGHTDQLLIVEAVTERPLAEIRGASMTKASWQLNGVGELDFSCSSSNSAMDHLVDPRTVVDGAGVMRLVGREIQWYRDGVLHWAGPPITGSPSLDGTVSFVCMDLLWYLFRKFFGAAERRDLLLGKGSMDKPGLPGWAMTPGCVKTRDTDDKRRGVASMALTGTGAASASFIRPTTTLATALPVYLTLMAKVPAGTPVGTAIASIVVKSLAGATLNQKVITVDEETPLGEWTRFDDYALLPPRAPHRVEVYLWSAGPHGATKFDDVRSLEDNTTGILPGADLSTHGVAGVNHVQKGRGQGPGFGITPVVVTNTGTVEPLGERHRNHIQMQDFLARYTDRADGFDFRVDPLRRQIQFAHRIGVDHVNIGLHDRTVASGGWTHNEAELSSKIVVPGEGDGVTRPEGGYTNTSRTAGLVLDYYHQPPDGTPLSGLDPTAEQVYQEKSQPQITYESLAVSDKYLGQVTPGDTLPGNLRSGKFRLPTDTRVRIGQVVLDRESGQLVLT